MSKVSIKVKDFQRSDITYGIRFDHFVESRISVSQSKIYQRIRTMTTTYGVLSMDPKACGGLG